MNKLLGSAAALAVTASVLSAAPALAKDTDVIRRGDCSGSATWKIKVGPDDGRLEVEAEIDSNRAGQRWRWTFRHNGTAFASGVRYTAGRSGSFEVRRTPANRAGRDTFVFRAVRPATGQVCRAVVSS